jgi:hypothetical protein
MNKTYYHTKAASFFHTDAVVLAASAGYHMHDLLWTIKYANSETSDLTSLFFVDPC